VKVVDHPAHNRDLAPSDFHSVFHLKKHLASQRFHKDKEIKNEVTAFLLVQAVKFYDPEIQNLKSWLNKCLDKSGDYGEK